VSGNANANAANAATPPPKQQKEQVQSQAVSDWITHMKPIDLYKNVLDKFDKVKATNIYIIEFTQPNCPYCAEFADTY
jgi:thiol-disulfide isomerase/thioredoxin